jgi:hypothetical protein
METLRKPLFAVAVALLLLAVLTEIGSSLVLPAEGEVVLATVLGEARRPGPAQLPDDSDVDLDDLEELRADNPAPPGLAISDMALLDGLLLLTVALMGIGLIVGERLHGRLQGVVSLVVSLLVLLASIRAVFFALGKLLVMVSLFLAPPFGTLAYMAMYGFFNRGGAVAVLSFLMLCKLGFLVCLVLAQQRFLQNKGLVLIVVTSLLANLVTAFLHALVPIFLVSITDAVAAIVAGVLAAIWALVFLVSAIVSILKAIRVDRSR